MSKKQCEVKVLSTDGISSIYHNPKTSVWWWSDFGTEYKTEGDIVAHHIYVINEQEKLNEGDYYIYNNEAIFKLHELDSIKNKYRSLKNGTEYFHNIELCKKIIASTDKRIQVSLSQKAIKMIMDSYNEGDVITKVMVEYEEVMKHCGVEFGGSNVEQLRSYIWELKLNSTKTIDIIPFRDRPYSLEELKELIRKYEKDNLFYGRDGYYSNVDIAEEWIKTNL